ncbi:MAG: DUF5667 domain-containing protein [Candidatus Paceibacterota bacterium]
MKHNKANKKRENVLTEKLKLLRGVSMNEKEKDRMSSFLSHYVELHPVLGEQERVIKARKETYSALSATFHRFMPAFAVFVFFIWGGVALAGTALPGGPLYGVKTASENIRESFSFNAEWKARFEARRVNRRLNEAHQLLERGDVSEKSIEELARELQTSLEDLDASLETLRADGEHLLAFEIEKASRSSINVYNDVFVNMSETSEHVGRFLTQIARKFSLASNHFASGTLGSSLALESEGGEDDQMSTMSLLTEEEGVDRALTEESSDTLRTLQSSEVQMMTVDTNEKSESETLDAGSALDLETLRLYASVRISETKGEVENARRLDERLRAAFLLRLEEARLLYEDAVSAEESQDESGARSLFLESLGIVENVRPLLRMGTSRPSELFISSILKRLENKESIEDSSILLDEEVRGVRKSSEEELDASREPSKGENRNADAEDSEQDVEDEVILEGVLPELPSEIEL